MKTKEQMLQDIEDNIMEPCFDLRDFKRLADFVEIEELDILGLHLKEGSVKNTTIEWTEENIIKQLKEDVNFAFEKALNQRGISSSFMYYTVKMWLWILEDDLYNLEDYACYGLPLFKAVAVKYGFDNQIGDDLGSEEKYAG